MSTLTRHFSAHRPHQAGMTLTELMVTLAVLAILISIAVPGMSDLIKDSRMSAQADSLASALNLARMEAIKRRTDVSFCPTDNSDTASACSEDVANWSKGWLIVAGGNVIQRLPGKTGMTITNANANVTFTGTFGSSTANSWTVCASGRKQQTVSVSASGHISKTIDTTTTCI